MSRPDRRQIYTLSLAELLAMSVWFSASAVVPALTRDWTLSPAGQSWLTMAVQIGFVVGAFGSAVLNLADRIPAPRLFYSSALLAALFTAIIPLSNAGLYTALFLRFLTGFSLAGVYPVGMKIMATWTRQNRGWGIGLLVGALTLGSSAPHLVTFLGGVDNWRLVLYATAGLAASSAFLAACFIKEGPYGSQAPEFNWKYAGQIWREKAIVLANLGYFGHMGELYAMWTWVPVFLLESFRISGIPERWASFVGFTAIAAGSAGSLSAGRLADRFGRTTIIITSLALSGACSLAVGLFYGKSPLLVSLICLIWGFAVVADSAQFSAGVSELCPSERTGTALTLQTSLGFLLTLATIRLMPSAERWLTWRWAFSLLAFGPLTGIWAILQLRRLAESVRMASGRR